MFDADGFNEAASKNLVLVSLDYPKGPDAIAKVPDRERNEELSEKYQIRYYPTVLLMTPGGEAFAEVRRNAPGSDAYLQQINELLSTGKQELSDIKKLTKAFEDAKGAKKRDQAFDAILTKLTEMDPGSRFLGPLVDVVSEVYPTAKDDRRKACIEALINAGRVDDDLLAAAKETDPDGSMGLWAKAVAQSVQGYPRNDEQVLEYQRRIADLFVVAKTVPMKEGEYLCMVMSTLAFRFDDDEAAAMEWAKKGLELIGDSDEAEHRRFFEDMLEE